jgi:dipeptidyl aminopeptidase/acylaminoacyl peptidase
VIGLIALGALSIAAARPFTVEELLQTRLIAEPQVSPDGRLVAFTLRQKSLTENRDIRDVWMVNLDGGGQARPFTRDGHSEHARWSPDGRSLLVVSTRGGDKPQLWLYDVNAGGDPRQLTSILGGAEDGTWSPSGRLAAFVSEVHPQCRGDAAAADACNKKQDDDRTASKVGGYVYDRLFVRHWKDWKEGKRSHLFVLSVDGGPARDLTPSDQDWPTWRLGGGDDFALSPDGTEITVSSKEAAHEAWSTNSDLWAIPTAGGPPKNLTADNPGDDSFPRYSPDGRYLAWLAQARDGYEADQWKLKLLDRKTGKVSILADFDDDVGPFVWRTDSKGLVASVLHHGRYYLNTVSVSGKVARFSESPAGDDFQIAANGTVVFVGSGMNRPPELYRLSPSGSPKPLTSLNQEQYAGLDLGPPPKEIWVDAKDGTRVHSWVLLPPGLAAGPRAPLIVLVHGGPQGAWEDQWGMRWNEAAFAARGYVVLATNFHGSTGYGHRFEESISRDWGGAAYEDVMKAVDVAEKLPNVQPGHTCAAGASFGGYMIDWIAGHTDRFKCLVTHDGVFDLVSMYGSTEELWFPEWDVGGGPYWKNREAYAHWSPSSYVQNFRTPTLVVQGELDYRVPIEQGLGMFTALQRHGIESRLLVFSDEGHWVNKPKNSQLWYQTVLDWIDQHARSGEP